jgi:hypothetical protein
LLKRYWDNARSAPETKGDLAEGIQTGMALRKEQDRKEADIDYDLMQVQLFDYTGSRQSEPLLSSFIS